MLFNDSAPFYDELATRFDVPLVDGELASLLRDSRYKSDPIHLNAEGYALLAGAIHEALIAHGAL
jgi:lysophospholipase L1-like esterase